MKHLHPLLFCLCALGPMNAQPPSRVAQSVQAAKLSGTPFKKISPFSKDDGPKGSAAAEGQAKEQVLMVGEGFYERFAQSDPEAVVLEIPYLNNIVAVELLRARILSPDFTVVTSASSAPVPYEEAYHFRGHVVGRPEAVAAFSIFKNEITGMIADPLLGNMSLGKMPNQPDARKHLFYEESVLGAMPGLECATPSSAKPNKNIDLTSIPEVSGCPRLFFEIDYGLYTEKGSVFNAVNHVTGLFNQVALIYDNIGVDMVISQIFVWVELDPYPNWPAFLGTFVANRTYFNGDLAFLITRGNGSLGGVATINTLCTSNNYGACNIEATYQNYPTWSFSVNLLAHEIGHSLGSHHTHWCGWTALVPTGGALDNCTAVEPEPPGAPPCSPGPPPSPAGTIMSYCNQPLALNFGSWNGGAGTQPVTLIPATVAAATCLSATCAAPPGCAPPTNLTVVSSNGINATISWVASPGAVSYQLQHRVVNSNTWTTVPNATSPYTLTNLPGDADVEIAIQSTCSGGSSGYYVGVIIKTEACAVPTNLTTTLAATSATLGWVENGASTTWEIRLQADNAPPTSGSLPTHSNVTSNPFTLTGLVSSLTYYVFVRSVCAGGVKSNWSSVHQFTTLLDCSTFPQILENNIYEFSFPMGSGNVSQSQINPPGACNYNTNGEENYFRFTPTQTGMYLLEATYTSSANTSVSVVYKADDNQCNANGWQCLGYFWSGLPKYGVGPLQAGVSYLFWMDSDIAFSAEVLRLKMHRQITIANPNNGSCTSYPLELDSYGENFWIPFKSAANAHAGFYRASQDLGAITVQMADFAAVPSYGGNYYMPRHFNINSAVNPTSDVDLVFLFRNDELAAYNAATGGNSQISGLDISYYDGPNEDCNPVNNTNGTTGFITQFSSFAFDANHFGVWFKTNHFTEFVAAEAFVPLPLELVRFFGEAGPNGNSIRWELASVHGINSLALERSPDATGWKRIHHYRPEEHSETKSYEYLDPCFQGAAFYRLVFEGLDGKTSRSPLVLIERADDGKPVFAPNPTDGRVQIVGKKLEAARLEAFDFLGKKVLDQTIQGEETIDFGEQPGGVLFLMLTRTDGTRFFEKIVKKN